MTAREPLWEQNGLSPIVNIMRVDSAITRSVRGASHQPAFMGSCLTISHIWKPCLPNSKWVKALYSMAPYEWVNGGSVDVFLTW